MKTSLLLSTTLAAGFALSHAATVTVTSLSTDRFSPDSISVNTGDTVNFTIASSHNVQEVSLTTYNADGTTALAGGFSTPFGGGKVVVGLPAGTRYYVCQAHASMGMRARLFVQNTTGINPVSQQKLSAFTFQIAGSAPIVFQLPGATVRISIVDIQGRSVWSTTTQNGARNASWDGKLADGSHLTAGAYFVQSVALDASHKTVGQMSSAMVQIP